MIYRALVFISYLYFRAAKLVIISEGTNAKYCARSQKHIILLAIEIDHLLDGLLTGSTEFISFEGMH